MKVFSSVCGVQLAALFFGFVQGMLLPAVTSGCFMLALACRLVSLLQPLPRPPFHPLPQWLLLLLLLLWRLYFTVPLWSVGVSGTCHSRDLPTTDLPFHYGAPPIASALPLVRALVRVQNTRGRLLTIEEVKQVGLKDELLERAKVLENDSRGWFEEDEELEARLAEVRYVSYVKRDAAVATVPWCDVWHTFSLSVLGAFCLWRCGGPWSTVFLTPERRVYAIP